MLVGSQPAAAQIATSGAGNTQDGLSVRADWLPANYAAGGYFPVDVELTSTRGLRELRVEIQNAAAPGSTVSRSVELDGNKAERFTIAFPLTDPHILGELKIYERGRELDKLRVQGIGPAYGWWGGAAPPNLLLVSRTAPTWAVFDQAIGKVLSGTQGNIQHIAVPPDRMPTKWIDLTTLDLVMASLSELEQMPAAGRDALLAWTMAGGNLVVYGVGTEREKGALDRLLDLEQRPPVNAQWRLPRPADRRIDTALAQSSPGQLGSQNWPRLAIARLESEGAAGYRRYCNDLLDGYAHASLSANDRNNLAWACVLVPDAEIDSARLVRLAELAVAGTSRNYAFLNTLGVALYRAGRFEEAVAKLNEATQVHAQGGTAADWLFLAMAHQRLGNKDAAKQWMGKAVQTLDQSGALSSDAELRLFRREADAVLNPTQSAEPSAEGKQPAGASKPPSPQEPAAAPEATSAQPAAKPDSTKVAPHFEIRAFGLGQLVRMSKPEPFPGSEEDWVWLFRTIGTGRINWSSRHGMTARSGNTDFWNFLIAGVGRAPVGAFQMLITVFAVAIGPLNYFLLRRRKRLYLLVATVPTVALVTTALLLGYAIASDGFSVRTRVRSLTLLDQVRGEAVSWSRISYYAGLAPAGGLRFSTDTAVYPLEPDDRSSRSRSVDWTDEQHLARGWLRSRTPAQLLTVAHRQTGEQLAVTLMPGGGLRATNNLGAEIKLVVLADDQGAFYAVENLARGLRGSLEPTNLEEARQSLRKLMQAQRVAKPDGMTESGNSLMEEIFGMRRFPWNRPGSTDWSSSLMEETLRRLSGTAEDFQSVLQPRTYLAIIERPPLVELGLHDVQDEGSLYVIWGVY